MLAVVRSLNDIKFKSSTFNTNFNQYRINHTTILVTKLLFLFILHSEFRMNEIQVSSFKNHHDSVRLCCADIILGVEKDLIEEGTTPEYILELVLILALSLCSNIPRVFEKEKLNT